MSTLDSIRTLQTRMGESIIGQESVIEQLIIGLLANGNILMEGLPGLAKTRAVKSLAKNMDAEFSRIQFTPDLLPSDITGSEVLYTEAGQPTFRFEAGPIFANIRSSPTSCWRMKLTVRPPRYRLHCLKPWKSDRSRWPVQRTRCRNCSS